MISGMEPTSDSQASSLCKSCGLCCTGHLFAWTKLRSAELDSAEQLGLKVFRSIPSQRGFNQPCPLWKGQCTVYDSPSYPHFCRTYKCALLKKLLDETITLHEALSLVEHAKGKIHELDSMLSDTPNPNFRERLAAQLEASEHLLETAQDPLEFRQKAGELLALYSKVFGVNDVVVMPPDPPIA
jgi:hypothetical protein